MSWLFTPGSQSIGTSASASVFPMNIQSWFPLGWTSLISLQSKGLSRLSPAPQFKSINFSVLSLLYGPTLTSMHDDRKNHSFDYMDFVSKMMLGKTEGKRRRGWQRIRWLDGITESMDMNLSKLWKMVKNRETWCAAIQLATVGHNWATELQQ